MTRGLLLVLSRSLLSRQSWLWLALFLAAGCLWSVDIGRPVDLPNWHEFDYSSIARNFVREGNNILFPRIDWRGDGPGYTEMEFPIVPWMMAQLYLILGTHEVIGRILSLLCALSSLWIFRKIALRVLPEPAAFVAALFLVINHEMVITATAIQPEALMLLCCLLAIYYYLDWYESQSPASYVLAVCSFSAAMLVKSPAAHLAIFFFLWAITKHGLGAFRKPSLYVFAVLSFVPPLLWYGHASSLWHEFHNSMGLSNEDHWLGLDIIRRPKVIANFLSIEFTYVLGVGGVLVVLAALGKEKVSTTVNRLALIWCLAVGIYLLVIMRTAGANWASYYHVVAVPPVALLFGVGVHQAALNRTLSWQRTVWFVLAPAVAVVAGLSWIGRRDTAHMPGVVQNLAVAQSGPLMLLVLAVLSLAVTVLCFSRSRPTFSRVASHFELSQWNIVVGCYTYFVFSSQLLVGSWKLFESRSPQFEAAVFFKQSMSKPGLIVTSGGICTDAGGHRLANDAPDMFYWLDRKGFTTCEGHESMVELEGFQRRGSRYFIAEKSSLDQQPQFSLELQKSYSLLAESHGQLLFSLDPRSK